MPLSSLLTEKQKKILELKLKGMSNREIASALGSSDEYISQTLKQITSKIQTVKDTIELFTELGLIEKSPTFRLSEEGFNLLRSRRAQYKRYITTVTFNEKTLQDYRIKPCNELCPLFDRIALYPELVWSPRNRISTPIRSDLSKTRYVVGYSNEIGKCA
ncbi:MAG: LuxR C-terminal-related transcriptional regulator [Candidatus Bathyarchaeia archaeon]